MRISKIPVIPDQATAEAGIDNSTYMTPLRTAQAIAAQGGGGGATKTVGSGGDYATVGDAIAAGARSLLMLSDTTETGNLTLTAPLRVTGGFKIVMDEFSIDLAGHNLVLEDVVLDYRRVSGFGTFIDSTVGTPRITFIGGGTQAVSAITNSCRPFGANVSVTAVGARFGLGNAPTCGVVPGGPFNYYFGIEIAGGGTFADEIITLNDGDIAEGVSATGAFATPSLLVSAGALLSNFDMTAHVQGMTIRGVLLAPQFSGSTSNTITLDGGQIIGGQLGNLYNVQIVGTSGNVDSVLSDCKILGTVSVANSVESCRITNCYISTLLIGPTATGGATVSNCVVENNIQVSAGVHTSLIGCVAGKSGVGTITIDAGVSNTRVIGCSTRSAISDSGTGTVVSGNVVIP